MIKFIINFFPFKYYNKIALHTFKHTERASQNEIDSGRKAISAFAGIPKNDIKGFRARKLSYYLYNNFFFII